MRKTRFLTFFGLFLCMKAARCLELLELRVPSHVPLGSRAQLACRWQLAPHDVLYSVKWYKDGREFFRHVPRDLEPRREFPLPGVNVEKSDMTGSLLTLSPAVLETGGRYRCEVSGERPLFATVSDHADLLVVALPSHGPVISGVRSHYAAGDRVRVACTSGRSRPATTLVWFVNDEPAPSTTVGPQLETAHPEGLVTSRREMDYRIAEEDFKDGMLIKIKCLATLGSVYWRSNEESAQRLKVPAYHGIDVERLRMDVVPAPNYGNSVMLCRVSYFMLLLCTFVSAIK